MTNPMNREELFKAPPNVSVTTFRFLLWKRYFDTGYGLTNYIKYAIALFGISSLDVRATLMIGLLYGIACVAIGWWWYRFQFVEIDNEISNRFNFFMREMREMRQKLEEKDAT